MKKLFDLHEQMYDRTMAMFQKQEKIMNQLQTQVKQIKSIIEKLESTIEGKKKSEWWEVQYISCNLYNIFYVYLYIF
jgi:hypothetical protein